MIYTANSPGPLPRLRGFLTGLARSDMMKSGKCVGTDAFGNRYFEDTNYTFGKGSRFFIPHDESFESTWDYDASDIPPEWHRWMTFMSQFEAINMFILISLKNILKFFVMTDKTPTTHPPVERKFQLQHQRAFLDDKRTYNTPLKKGRYIPYSTTRQKVEHWDHSKM